MKHTEKLYEFPGQLFRAHDAETPKGYAREAYERTSCGIWTAFVFNDGDRIMSDDLPDIRNNIEWASRHIVGIAHGTIVEGSSVEFEADHLLFPFTDKELAETWQYLDDQVTYYDIMFNEE